MQIPVQIYILSSSTDISNQFLDQISVPVICFANKIFLSLALSKGNNFLVLHF